MAPVLRIWAGRTCGEARPSKQQRADRAARAAGPRVPWWLEPVRRRPDAVDQPGTPAFLSRLSLPDRGGHVSIFGLRKTQMVTSDTALPGRATAMPVPERNEVLGTPLRPPYPAGTDRKSVV